MFDSEFRSNYGYNQPASPLASVGVMAAGSGDTASKYVARRETPLYIPENCTQCMECIAVCPDTALPNCSQELETVLRAAIANYVTDPEERAKMFRPVPEIDKRTTRVMRDSVAAKVLTPLPELLRKVTNEVDGFSEEAEAPILRRHRESSDGLPEGQRDLFHAGKENAGSRRHFLHFRFGLVQRMRCVSLHAAITTLLRMVQNGRSNAEPRPEPRS